MERFHGVDRHKAYSTISVLNREGVEVEFHPAVRDLKGYLEGLGPEDAVVLEASSGSFWWADQIEMRGARCFVINPHRFRIIKDSWNKTDTRDSRNMAKALWVFMVTGEFGLPTVYKPSCAVRELRRLFAFYDLVTRQITMLKNGIQALLIENGIELKKGEKSKLLSPFHGRDTIRDHVLSAASRTIVSGELDLLWTLGRKKQELAQEILRAGECFQAQVELLITIRGITPLTALAFLSDVGDISRFTSAREMDSYLGLVPRCSDSGGKQRRGHITRHSRRLTRTILTQSLVQVVDSSPQFRRFYDQLKDRRGAGRARIALIRKLCGVMRRMLISGEEYRNKEAELFGKKRELYRRILATGRGEGEVLRKTA